MVPNAMRFDRADVVRDSHNSSNGGEIMTNKRKIPLYESLRESLVSIVAFMCLGVIFYPIVLWICFVFKFYSLWDFLLSPFKGCLSF